MRGVLPHKQLVFLISMRTDELLGVLTPDQRADLSACLHTSELSSSVSVPEFDRFVLGSSSRGKQVGF